MQMKKEKYSIEYVLGRISAPVLWPYLSTANGLSEWFADNVEVKGKDFVFIWSKVPQEALLMTQRQGVFIRFHWKEDEGVDSKAYFEFRIDQTELTDDITLIITDFAYPDEKDESISLWNQQISALKRLLGC